ncbi:MAG: ABC transporter ATP-binding protein [Planctomycetes bacterium]|nr:ABC transporter ATP-binding protein [Planctomycetota bacterium]
MRVELARVTRRFGALTALRDVSVEFRKASHTALVGPNGSGKSTLVRVMMGLLRCDGRVRIDDLDPVKDRAALAPRVAYMPQVAPRLHATVRELTSAVARLRCMSIEPIVDVANQLNLDLERVGRKPFRTLSGGMRQKLLGAFTLGVGAELMILDEPTASMDAESRQRFFDIVQRLDPAPTLFLCSHRLEEIRNLVDDVLALEDGSIVHHSSVEDLLSHTGRSVVELRSHNGRADGYLRTRGFDKRASGWWRAVVASSDRARIVTEVTSELGDGLVDIVLRDAEDSVIHSDEKKEA